MNRLQYAASPYLLQHARNPVDWYPWGAEAFERAERENKPVLVSIGYAACHWCHVMAHESFEDPETAAFMNAHFVNIKIDREEHPDVDHLYMDALQALSGTGGWPLNMFVTPDKKPFYGGTYFPPRPIYNRASWMDVLRAISDAWNHHPGEITRQAEQLVQHLQQASEVTGGSSPVLPEDITTPLAEQLLQQADKEWGGFGAAPKFPDTFSIGYLLEYYHFRGKTEAAAAVAERALQQALLTLDKMIAGGIYDQIGGGFARYATDKRWQVPHFEKMLYDNALLVSVLSDAWRLTGREHYRQVIEETLAFCDRELKGAHSEGYFCSLDADSEGIEGRFYTWSGPEWESVMGAAHPAIIRYFGVSGAGSWEHTNILQRTMTDAEVQEAFSLPEAAWRRLLHDSKEKLFRNREKRVPPAADDKMLLSWNALMNKALVKAATALRREDYLNRAGKHLQWLLETFDTAGGLKHACRGGQPYLEANLDDYAYLIQALLSFSEASGGTEYIIRAATFMETARQYFAGEDSCFFYFSDKRRTDIIVRKTELYDGATPSANAVMAENLALLGYLTGRTAWIEQSGEMLRRMQATVSRYARSFAYWGILLQRYAEGWKQLVISGKDAAGLLKEWQKHYHPDIFALCQKTETAVLPVMKNKFPQEGNLLYLCTLFQCDPPVTSIEDLRVGIKK